MIAQGELSRIYSHLLNFAQSGCRDKCERITAVTDVAHDYRGEILPQSGAPQSWLNGHVEGVTLGSNGNDAIYGTGETELLNGGGGDDSYYIYSPRESVMEAPGGGVDTIFASWTDIQLPANVENLFVSGSYYGVGNDDANIIVGDVAAQTLDGRGGDDVLTGGGGEDIFVFSAGSGHDVITDFTPSSGARLRLSGFPQATSFQQLSSQLMQIGPDVVVTLDASDSITLRNVSLSALGPGDFQLGIDLSHATRTFDEEFDSLRFQQQGGAWRTDFGYGPDADSLASRTLTNNHELEIYVDPSFRGDGSVALGLNPFSIDAGVLTITAAVAPSNDKVALYGYGITSGLLTTQGVFSQEYGYFEIRAQLPAGDGAWPAFWLLPSAGAWPPELDVLESFGDEKVFSTVHSGGDNTQQRTTTLVTGATSAFHTYGMLWTADYVTWYVDGVETGRIATPSDMHQAMYLLVNLAVADGAGSTAVPAELKVDYVRAYTLTPDQSAPPGAASATYLVSPFDRASGLAAPEPPTLVGHPGEGLYA